MLKYLCLDLKYMQGELLIMSVSQGARKNIEPTLFTSFQEPVNYDHGICYDDTLKYHWPPEDCNSTKFKVLTLMMMTIMIQALWDTVYCWLAIRFLLFGHLGIWTLNMKEAASSSKMPVITYQLTHHIPEDMDSCLQTGTSTQIYRPQGTADLQWAYYCVISSRVKLHHGSMWVSCQLRYFSPTGYGPHMMDTAER